MSSTRQLTRRGFVKGAAASGAALSAPVLLRVAPALARTEDPVPAKPCRPAPPGTHPAALAITPDARMLWVTESARRTITPVRTRDLVRGDSVDVGGAPIDIAIARNGRTALVLTAFYDRPGLAFVNLARGKLERRVSVGGEPFAVAIAPDGERAYVTGGGAEGTLTPVNLGTGSAGRPIAIGAHPRGVTVAPDGERVIVALNGAAGLAVVDVRRRRVTRTIATSRFPYRVATSPDGRRAMVTHSGYGANEVTLLDLTAARVIRRIRAGADPYAVAFSGDGETAIVSDYGAAAVALLDLQSGRVRSLHVGHRPRGLAVARKGGRAYVINEFEGTVSAIRLPRARAASRSDHA